MRKLLCKTLFLLMGGLLCGTSAFAGDEVDLGNGTSRLGAEDNTTGWWTQFTDFVEIAPNKTLTYTFKNYSSKANNWNNWALEICEKVSGYEYLLMRADCFGLTNGEWEGRNTNDNSTGWFLFNSNTYDWDNFKENIDGATVVMTIKRKDAALILIEDVTTADGTKKFRHFFAMDCPMAVDETLKARLTVDNAHIIINNEVPVVDTEVLTATGTQIGRADLATTWFTAFSDYYTIGKNQMAKFHFKNYSCKGAVFYNWLLFVTTDADRGGDGYKEYVALRADNYGWGENYDVANLTSDYNWDTFMDEMDGADVTMTVKREGGTVTIVAKQIAATDGTTVRTETYTFTDDAIAENNIRVFLSTEGGMIDLLSANVGIETTIGAKDWSTFSCADYGLDFANADEGLTAYAITGHDGKKITRTAVTGAVEKNTGLLLNGEAGKTYFIPVATTGSAVSKNLLVPGTGSAVTRATGKTYYVLTNEDGIANFKKLVTDDVVIPVGKAYLRFDEVVEAREIAIDGEFTGINEIKASDMKNAEWYDLQGRRVANPVKGLYIVNGKKVILK
ncbi:MAG: hypothetical protein IJ552_01485 [Prevotella sp.]|nr:hypothetical protein [Prevotella sp.]